jgi:xanthine dehydrogenase accessory factor
VKYGLADVFNQALQWIEQGHSFLAALVIAADGSTPQKPGARASIDAEGRIFGTIGGGWVEAEVQRRAADVCRSKRPTVLSLRLTGESAAGDNPICGGEMRILLDPDVDRMRDCFASALKSLRNRRRGLLLTSVSYPAEQGKGTVETKLRWLAAEEIESVNEFPGPAAMQSCLDKETPRLFADNRQSSDGQASPTVREVFVEPVLANPHLVIAGGGHVGQALAAQAAQVGFDVTVLDDRPEFTAAPLFGDGVQTRCGNVPELAAALSVEHDTYIAIVTRGHAQDAETLAACIRSPAAYIGMIGSRRKVALMRQSFLEQGLATEAQWDRVHAPIGLDIGSITVPEIAASITAQLIAVRRKRYSRGEGSGIRD